MGQSATQTLLDSLRNEPDKWHCEKGVCAFRAHERQFPEEKMPDGSTRPAELVKVTDKDLERLAAWANEEDRSGNLLPVTIGHRQFAKTVNEKDQAELTGFARNWRVEPVRNGTDAFLGLVYDEYVPVDQTSIYRRFPFRSADYHPNTGIMGVAALIRPPALPLGTVYRYQRGGYAFHYQLEHRMADATTPTPEDEEMKEYAKFSKFMKKYQDEMAAAGASNGTLPAPVKNPDVTTYAADPAVAVRIAKLEQERAEDQKRIVESESRRLLDQAATIVKFDYARELSFMASMPDNQKRGEHLAYMLDTYTRLPLGTMIRTYAGDTAPPAAVAPSSDPYKAPPKHEEIMTYMRAHPGMTYQDAKVKITEGK